MPRVQEPQQVIGGQLGGGVLESLTQGRAMAENRLVAAMRQRTEAAGMTGRFGGPGGGGGGGGGGNEKELLAMQLAERDRRAAEKIKADEEDRQFMTDDLYAREAIAGRQAAAEYERQRAKEDRDYVREGALIQELNDIGEAQLALDEHKQMQDEAFMTKWLEAQPNSQADLVRLVKEQLKKGEETTAMGELRGGARGRLAATLENFTGAMATDPVAVAKFFDEAMVNAGRPGITLELFNDKTELLKKIATGEIVDTDLVMVEDILDVMKLRAGKEKAATVAKKGKIQEEREALAEEALGEPAWWTYLSPFGSAAAHAWELGYTKEEVKKSTKLMQKTVKLNLGDKGSRKLTEASLNLLSLRGDKTKVVDDVGKDMGRTVGDVITHASAVALGKTSGDRTAGMVAMLDLDADKDKALLDSWRRSYPNPRVVPDEVLARLSPGVRKILEERNARMLGYQTKPAPTTPVAPSATGSTTTPQQSRAAYLESQGDMLTVRGQERLTEARINKRTPGRSSTAMQYTD